MRRSPNAVRIVWIGALLAATALLTGCDSGAATTGLGLGMDTTGRPTTPGGAEDAMATEPPPVSPSAPVSPRVATPGVFSPGPTGSGTE